MQPVVVALTALLLLGAGEAGKLHSVLMLESSWICQGPVVLLVERGVAYGCSDGSHGWEV